MSAFQLQRQLWDSQTPGLTCIKSGRSTGKVFATGWDDNKVRVFALGMPKAVLELDGLDCNPTGLQFNGVEEVLAGGDEKGLVTLWSLKQGKVARTLEGSTKATTEIAFHPSGAFCAVAGHDLTTRVWDLRAKKCVQTYSAHEKTTSLSFSPGNGGWIVSGGDSGLTKVWDVRAGKILTTLKKHTGAVTDIAFHSQELVMATAGADGIVNFWNVNDFAKLSSTTAMGSAVKSVCFASDSSLAMAITDSAFRSYSWSTPQASVLESQCNLSWGPVKDAFTRRDKLVVATGEAHCASAWVLDLAPFINKALDSENVAPKTETAKKSVDPIDSVPASTDVPSQPPCAGAALFSSSEQELLAGLEASAVPQVAAVVMEQKPQQTEQKQAETAPLLTNKTVVDLAPIVSAVEDKRKPAINKQADVEPPKRSSQGAVNAPQPVAEEKKKGSRKQTPAVDFNNNANNNRKSGGSHKQRKDPSLTALPASSSSVAPSVCATIAAPATLSGSAATTASTTSNPVKQNTTTGSVVAASLVGIVPSQREKVLGLKAEEFRSSVKAIKSEEDALTLMMDDHANMCATLATRKAHVTAVRAMWNKDMVTRAIVQLHDAKELSVVYDVLGGLNTQAWSVVPLESLPTLLQDVCCLLQCEYEDYVVLGCTALRHIQKCLGPSIKSARDFKQSEGDICWELLVKCSAQLKENMTSGGRISQCAREVLSLFRRLGI